MQRFDFVVKHLKNILKWVFSNTLWSIISLGIPFTLLIPVIKETIGAIVTKTYTIKLVYIILVIIFFVIETLFFLVLIYVKKKDVKENIHTKNKNDKGRDYDKLDYYFERYHKHLTVYKNGNGILINSFTLVINNINAITEFKRELNIHDSKAATVFPKLKVMKKTNLNERYSKFGFWFKCLNNEDLIADVREYYWSNNNNTIDTIAQTDPKVLKWIMQMNPSSIEIGKPYDIVYVISIPGMFPIENGQFSDDIANIKGTQGRFSSQFNVKHKIKHLKYTVSFENGLKIYKKPFGVISFSGKTTNLNYINDNNIIFDKYIFNTYNPECNSVINIEWKFKERRTRRKNGGSNMKGRNEIERGD